MADKNRNDSSKIDGFYQFLKHDIDSMKSALTTEMRLCSSQIGFIYKGIKEDKDASSAALEQEIRYSYKQNQNIYEGLAVLLKKEVAERINSMDDKMSSMAKLDEILSGINDLKDSYNQLQEKYESLSNVISETVVPKLEKIVDKDEMKGIITEVVPEPKYERISQEVGAELEKVLIALKANEAVAMAEDAADIAMPSEVDYGKIVDDTSAKVMENLPEQLKYEEIDASVKNAMEEVVNADEIAEAVAAKLGATEVDYERLANLVVEKLAAKGISAEVILDDEGIARIADTVVEKVGTVDNIDYEKVSLAAQAAQIVPDPIDYERVAEIVDDKLTKTCDTMERMVALDNDGIGKIVDGVAGELRNMTLVCEYAPAEDADEEDVVVEEAPVEEVVEESVYVEPEQVAIEEVIETPVEEIVTEEIVEAPVEEVVEAPVEEAPAEDILDLNDVAVFQAAVAAKLDELEEREAAAEIEVVPVEEEFEEVVDEVLEEVIAEESPVEEVPVVEEIAVAAEPVYEEDSEGQLVDATTGLVVRLKRSFTAKLKQSEEQVKVYYSDIKNALTSYKKINSNVSWHGDRFNYGRDTVAKIGINGKTLCFYLALDPNDPELKQTVYHQKDVSAQKAYESTPFMVKVKSEAASKKALRLVGILADKLGAEHDQNFEEVDYVAEYAKQGTKQLFEAGEIKATKEKKADFNNF